MTETCQNKASEVKLKTTRNVLVFGPQIQVIHRNKLLLYKYIIEPIWTYGIQLWGCTKPSNKKIIQRFQSKFLRLITSAPWYVSNFTLYNDLQIQFVIAVTHILSTLYIQSVLGHNNRLIAEISKPTKCKKKIVRRPWPSDLQQPADEES
jgi:hypothetical protein